MHSNCLTVFLLCLEIFYLFTILSYQMFLILSIKDSLIRKKEKKLFLLYLHHLRLKVNQSPSSPNQVFASNVASKPLRFSPRGSLATFHSVSSGITECNLACHALAESDPIGKMCQSSSLRHQKTRTSLAPVSLFAFKPAR